MTARTTTRASLTAGAAVAGLFASLALAGPAAAETAFGRDGLDTRGHTDITRATVRHRDRAVVARVGLEDLRRQGTSGLTVFYDVNRDRRGPEYGVFAGINEGTDYQLTRTSQRWRATGREPLRCNVDLALQPAKDQVTVRVPRRCIGTPGKVRVAIRATASYRGSQTRDWLGGFRHWTRWLDRG